MYWFANNIITTAQQIYLRTKFKITEEDLDIGDLITELEPPPELTDYDKATKQKQRMRGRELKGAKL